MQRTLLLIAMATTFATAATGQTDLPPVKYENGRPMCPTDTDIRNIDTRLSARVVPPSNAASLHRERQKAVQCRMIGGRYSEADWKKIEAVIRGDE